MTPPSNLSGDNPDPKDGPVDSSDKLLATSALDTDFKELSWSPLDQSSNRPGSDSANKPAAETRDRTKFAPSSILNEPLHTAQEKKEWYDTLGEIKDEFEEARDNPRLAWPAAVFFFYGLLGLGWGFAIDDPRSMPAGNDWWIVFLIHLPFVALFPVVVWQCRRHGTLWGMPLWLFVTCAVVGFVSPIVLCMLS